MSNWNPRVVLRVYPENERHCVGNTREDNRCTNQIGRDDVREAGRILDSLAFISLQRLLRGGSPLLRETLIRLSDVTLCRRNHRDNNRQIEELLSTWLSRIQEHQRSSRHSQTGRSVVPSAESHHQYTSSSTTPTATSHSRLPSTRSSTRASDPDIAPPSETGTTSSRASTTSSSRVPSSLTSSPARRNQQSEPIVAVIFLGSILAAGDIILNFSLNSPRAGQSTSNPPPDSHSGVTPLNPPTQSITPPQSPSASVSHRTPSSTSGTSAASYQSSTHHDVQRPLEQIASLGTRFQQFDPRTSSSSSRSSNVSSRPVPITPSSPTLSTLSEPPLAPPWDAAWLFLSPPQSPLIPPAFGLLSVSSDSNTSPTTMTPSSSGMSSPVLGPIPLSGPSASHLAPHMHRTLSISTDSSSSSTIMTPSSSGTSTVIPQSPPRSPRPSPPTPSAWSIPPRSSEPTPQPRAPPTNTPCQMCRQPTTPSTLTQCHNLIGCRSKFCTPCINSWISSQLDSNMIPTCPFWYRPPMDPPTFLYGTDVVMAVAFRGSFDSR